MASTSGTARARKSAVSLETDDPASDILDSSSTDDSDIDAASSEFGSDEEDAADLPGTSAVTRRVVTSFGQDVLPPAQKSVEFRPQRDPGIDLVMTLRSGPKRLS
ncbi:uncharacterized protein LOC142566041 [Dermacentor variabilis]|uniref:uncharacterized protein LOC142566041 n=1 Tax=Dermacentor variabilis TaxID=34621 RepID=UPI003F5BE22C